MQPIFEVKNLSVNYGCVQALKKVSLEIQEREIVCLIGSNGAGKSTLMKAILGVVQPLDGEIYFKSKSILGKKSYEIVAGGMSQSPEGRQVFSDLSVFENLKLGAYASRLTRAQEKSKFQEICEIFPVLRERSTQLAGTLSGGEQQMLAIGRALMSSPSLLLLDEPSLGIAPMMTERIFDILLELNKKGMAILLAEQNAAMALEISMRGYVLEVGEIIHQDFSSALMSNQIVKNAYLGI
jgi:branched-chain amino acid transport system ATP-binding protein